MILFMKGSLFVNKKIKSVIGLLLTFVMLLSIAPVSVFAEGDVLSYLTYEINNGEVTITDCDESISGDVVIPDIIEGYPVTSIGKRAFRYCKSIENITIPDSVTSIGDSAFNGCTALSDINLPDSAILLGYGPFSNTIYYNNDANWEDGVLYIGKHLIATDQSVVSGHYVVKEGTKSIAAEGFYGCALLTDITIPDSVEYIGEAAFNFCTAIKEIILPTGLKAILESTFVNCYSLENIVIPDSVTCIVDWPFGGCVCLKNISFPSNVSYIGNSLIFCPSITDVYIYNPDAEIAIGAFSHYGLKWENVTAEEYAKLYAEYFAAEVSRKYTREELDAMESEMQNIIGEEYYVEMNYTIHGYAGSTAEAYALENGFEFVELCEHNYISGVIKEPTATEVGIKADVCEYCGDIINAEENPMLENDEDITEDTNTPEAPEDSENEDNSSLSFIEIIIQFFQKIIEFIKNLFNR